MKTATKWLLVAMLFLRVLSAQDNAPQQDDPYDPHPEEAHCDNTYMPATPEHSCHCERAEYCPPQNAPGAEPNPNDAPPEHMPNCRHYCRADKCGCSGMCES